MWTKFIPIFKIYSSGNFFFWWKANDVAVMEKNKAKHKLEENIRKIFKDIFIFSIHKVCIWKYLSYYQTISVSAVLIFDPCSPLFNSKNWFWLRHDSCLDEVYLSESNPCVNSYRIHAFIWLYGQLLAPLRRRIWFYFDFNLGFKQDSSP